jgi:hypothetical protein
MAITIEAPAPQADVIAAIGDELSINIVSRGFTEWHGTRAQLEAEGILPAHVCWPTGTESQQWCDSEYRWCLRRVRPKGRLTNGSWKSADRWMLDRLSLSADGLLGAAVVYQKQMELAEAIFRQSREFHVEWSRWWVARDDDGFQAFMVLAGCGKLRLRKSKAGA